MCRRCVCVCSCVLHNAASRVDRIRMMTKQCVIASAHSTFESNSETACTSPHASPPIVIQISVCCVHYSVCRDYLCNKYIANHHHQPSQCFPKVIITFCQRLYGLWLSVHTHICHVPVNPAITFSLQ